MPTRRGTQYSGKTVVRKPRTNKINVVDEIVKSLSKPNSPVVGKIASQVAKQMSQQNESILQTAQRIGADVNIVEGPPSGLSSALPSGLPSVNVGSNQVAVVATPHELVQVFQPKLNISNNIKRIIGFIVFAALGFVASFFGLNQFKQVDDQGRVLDKVDHTKMALGISITILAGLIGIGISMLFFEGLDLEGL